MQMTKNHIQNFPALRRIAFGHLQTELRNLYRGDVFIVDQLAVGGWRLMLCRAISNGGVSTPVCRWARLCARCPPAALLNKIAQGIPSFERRPCGKRDRAGF